MCNHSRQHACRDASVLPSNGHTGASSSSGEATTQAVGRVTGPRVVRQVRDQPRPQRVALDAAADGQQVLARGRHRALEAPRPDVARGLLRPVVMPGVGHGQRLEDAADALPGGWLPDQVA